MRDGGRSMNPLLLSAKDGQETVVVFNVVFAVVRDITEQNRLDRSCTSSRPTTAG